MSITVAVRSVVGSGLEAARGVVEEFLSAYGPEYLWVPVSGGKDSAAVWGVVDGVTRDYIVVYIQIPGQTHMDNVRSVLRTADILGVSERVVVRVSATRKIRETLKNAVETCGRPCLLRVVAFDTHGRDFWAAMRQYGFPAPLGRFGRGTRWCCGTFKHRVLQRLPYNGTYRGRPWKYGANGVKATDSPYRRRKYRGYVQTWEKTRDTYVFPLLQMEDQEVWELLDQLGLREVVWSQYEKWGRSPNCMWCPMLGKSRIRATAVVLPESVKRKVAVELRGLLPRYREGTYSYRAIRLWLEALEE